MKKFTKKIKYEFVKKWLFIILLVAISSGLYSFFTDFLIIPSGIYSGGFTGITQIIIYSLIPPSDEMQRKVWFYIVYLSINLPLIIFGWFKIGKKLSVITFLFIISQQLWNILWTSKLMINFQIMPELLESQTKLFGVFIFAVIGGVTWASSNSIVYHAGGCGGGTDFVATYFAIKKNKSIGNFQILIQITILLCAITMNYIVYKDADNYFMAFINNPIFYASIAFAFTAGFTFNKCFNNKKMFFVILKGEDVLQFTEELDKLKFNYEINEGDIFFPAMGKKDLSILKQRLKELINSKELTYKKIIVEINKITKNSLLIQKRKNKRVKQYEN